jgi:uncharacterized protein YgbK (DUF1537 family)
MARLAGLLLSKNSQHTQNMLLTAQIQAELRRQNRTIIVLDDDPTGTQTLHSVPVLTEWTQANIQKEFEQKTPIFFILTNSRSLIAEKANALGFEIGQNINKAAQATGRAFYMMSRGDSTLRGHFPNEIDALAKGLEWGDAYVTALIPAFFEGNRFTKNDIHYWKNGEDWIPVNETPYARDATFGYKNADLKQWIEEKTQGKIKASEVASFNPNIEGVAGTIEKLNALQEGTNLIVNALTYEDLDVFALAALSTEKQILYRTSASFVRSFAGILPKSFLTREALVDHNAEKTGGLIVIGSHVPKTTAQLNALLKTDIEPVLFDIYQFFRSDARSFVSEITLTLDEMLKNGKNVVLYTSRNVVLGKNKDENLQLSTYISGALVTIVSNLKVRPAFLIAKGGITSSDIATKSLRVKRAMCLGQIIAGVPVWQLGEETKFPGMTYVIFPGNVGADEDLKNVYQIMTC